MRYLEGPNTAHYIVSLSATCDGKFSGEDQILPAPEPRFRWTNLPFSHTSSSQRVLII